MRLRFLPFVFLLLTDFQISAVAQAGPLADAAIAGDESAVASLLDKGVAVDEEGVATPLYFAAQRGHLGVAELLVSHGADVNAQTNFGTPLQIAARQNRVEIVRLLLDNGADPNLAGGEDLKTPLHDAAERGSLEAARLLLDAGADVNSRSSLGYPPIHLAAKKGRAETVEFLEQAGAAPKPAEPLIVAELAAADLEEGRVKAQECLGCHALEPGTKPLGSFPGPDLWNVVGRKKASMEGYAYSGAMLAKGGTWGYEDLNRFLADPTGYVPGTNMGITLFEMDRRTRILIIAYLRTLSDEPIPLE